MTSAEQNGDVGEWVAARYYGVPLAKTRTHGYDLTTADGRCIQVKTLKDGNDGRRSEAGRVLGPCDMLLMIRLAPDFTPLEPSRSPSASSKKSSETNPSGGR